MKFLGVPQDENLTLKDHINIIENKISKNIGLIFRAKNVLNKDSLMKLYYPHFNCYLNYANMAWDSAHKTNLHKVHLKEKNAIRLICNETKFAHTKLFMRSLQILTIF